jgi:hypothetical protein
MADVAEVGDVGDEMTSKMATVDDEMANVVDVGNEMTSKMVSVGDENVGNVDNEMTSKMGAADDEMADVDDQIIAETTSKKKVITSELRLFRRSEKFHH